VAGAQLQRVLNWTHQADVERREELDPNDAPHATSPGQRMHLPHSHPLAVRLRVVFDIEDADLQ
jgi:hypothetical protein